MNQENVVPYDSQKIYQHIKLQHPTLKLFSSADLKHVLSWYITNGNLTIPMKKYLCVEYNKINDDSYYHLLPHFKIIQYDNWILLQISKTI